MSVRQKNNNARLPKGANWLRFDQAVMLMHRPDSRMARMHTVAGPLWLIVTSGGGYVKPEDATKILARPDLVGMEDALFPGLDQTYRMRRG